MMKYKCSFYNYHISDEKEHLIYNTLYSSLVRLNNEEYSQFISCDDSNEVLAASLLENGIWVEEDIDERKNYTAAADFFTYTMKKKPFSLTLTTTMKCNARCSYCFEQGACKSDFNEDLIDPLFENVILPNSANGIELVWFGGEPMMNPDLIDKITERLDENNINYSGFIISNGSLFTEDIINNKLEKWKIHSLQVTLDGTAREYEKRKNFCGAADGIYFKILFNLRQIAEKNINIRIRINIDKNNTENIFKLLGELEYFFGNCDNVSFYPAFVVDSEASVPVSQREEIVYKMFKTLKNPLKLTVSEKLYSIPRTHSCTNNNPFSAVVDVEGNIFRCEHYVGKEAYSVGRLTDGIYKRTNFPKAVLRKECYNCKFLPKCMGGCEANRLEGDSACMIDKYMIKAYLKFLSEK